MKENVISSLNLLFPAAGKGTIPTAAYPNWQVPIGRATDQPPSFSPHNHAQLACCCG